MKKRATTSGVQMFSFLDAMICTLGALLVLLHAFARHGHDDALRKAEAKAVQEAGEDPKVALELVEWRIEELRKSRAKTEAQLADERLKLSHVEDHERRLQQKFKELKISLAELERATDSDDNETLRDEAALEALRVRLVEARDAVERARERNQRAASYHVVPYEGPNSTHRRPIYIECRDEAMILQPEGVELTPDDFAGYLGPGNPLASALRGAREYFARRTPDDPDAGEPYPLLLVRPEGVMTYYAARSALQSWGADFGYELIGSDWNLNYSEPNPQLAQLMRQIVADARHRMRELMLATASLNSHRSHTTLRASPHGGFVASRGSGGNGRGRGTGREGHGWDSLDSDWVRGGSRAGSGGTDDEQGPRGGSVGGNGLQQGGNGSAVGGNGPQRGDGTGGLYANGGQWGPGGGGVGGFNGTPGRAGPGNGAMPQNANTAGTGGGSMVDGQGRGSGSLMTDGQNAQGPGTGNSATGQATRYGANGGQPSGQTDGQASGQPSEGDTQSAGPGGQYATQGAKAGSTGGRGNAQKAGQVGPNATGVAQGGAAPSMAGASGASSSAGTSSASGSSSSSSMTGGGGAHASSQSSHGKPPSSMAKSRGRDWGLPNADDSQSPVTRPILVECYRDRLVIVPDDRAQQPQVTRLDAEARDSVDEFVSDVWKHMNSWGIAGRGLYWRPTLVMAVKPGGEARYAELEALLADSGLDVRQRRTPAPPAAATKKPTSRR